MVSVPEIITIPAQVGDYGPADIGPRAYSRHVLATLKLPTPPAFVVTPTAFYHFLSNENGLNRWRQTIENAHAFSPEDMVTASQTLQKLVQKQSFDSEITTDIFKAYDLVLQNKWAHLTISPTPTTQAPVNLPLPVIKGETAFLDFLRQLWSSQITPQALALSLTNHPQRMFQPSPILVSAFEPAVASGTVTTIDPLTKDKHLIRVEAIWGTNPQPQPELIPADIYIADKQHQTIISRTRTNQAQQIMTDHFGHYHTQPVSPAMRGKQKLTDDQIVSLIQAAQKIHDYSLEPQVINWLMVNNIIFFTRFASFDPNNIPQYKPTFSPNQKEVPKVIATGLAAAPGIVTAPILHPTTHHTSLSNRIAIFKTGDPQLIQRARTAAGIIIESGGLTSELAIVARETGIPTLVGTGPLGLPDDQVVTLDATHNQIVKAPPPTLPIATPQFETDSTSKQDDEVLVTATPIYLTASQIDPSQAAAYTHTAGIGICRGADIFSTTNVHPKQLLKKNWSKAESLLIASLQDLCQTLGERPVYYLPYDLDTDSAAQLTEGKMHEPTIEQNPLIGFRGAYRIIKDSSVFEAELRAISTLRRKYGIKNLSLILPLIRSLDEIEPLVHLISDTQLYASPSFQIWAEIGTPAAIDLIPDLQQAGIQGVHLNLDLLAALTLGFDPNSAEVDQCVTILHPSVLAAVAKVADLANKAKIPVIASAYQLNQSYEAVYEILSRGVNALSISPPRFAAVQAWVSQTENKIVTSQRGVKIG